jgi:hypothetical protein
MDLKNVTLNETQLRQDVRSRTQYKHTDWWGMAADYGEAVCK